MVGERSHEESGKYDERTDPRHHRAVKFNMTSRSAPFKPALDNGEPLPTAHHAVSTPGYVSPADGAAHHQHRGRQHHQRAGTLCPAHTLALPKAAGQSLTRTQLWVLYNKLPTPTSSSAQRVQHLKREIVRLKRELAATSPQDNFSGWAKLDRQHNKATSEYQKLGASPLLPPFASPS